jgi:DNA-binding transcriptional ArsR family regulator
MHAWPPGSPDRTRVSGGSIWPPRISCWINLQFKAMGHPFQGRLLQAVSEKSKDGVSIRQLAARLTEPTRRIRYHLDALSDLGLVEVLRVTGRRGVTERFYRVAVTPQIRAELLDRDQARRVSLEALKAIIADAGAAVGAKLFGMRPGHAVIRVRAEVDPTGWHALVAIQERALKEVEAVVERSQNQLKASNDPGICAVAAMLLFEVPPWPEG